MSTTYSKNRAARHVHIDMNAGFRPIRSNRIMSGEFRHSAVYFLSINHASSMPLYKCHVFDNRNGDLFPTRYQKRNLVVWHIQTHRRMPASILRFYYNTSLRQIRTTLFPSRTARYRRPFYSIRHSKPTELRSSYHRPCEFWHCWLSTMLS